MRFGRGLAFAYDEAWAFFRRGWWLVLMPLLPLVAADLAFLGIGRSEAREPVLWSMLLLTAMLKAALPYCVMRFVALGHDLAAALRLNRASAKTYAPYFAAMTALDLVLLIDAFYGDSETFTTSFAIVLLLALALLSPRAVTAPSGSTVIGPAQSSRLVLPHFLWALAFLLLVIVPAALLQATVGALVERSAPLLLASAVDTVFNAALDLLLIVAQLVIALKAGVRIGADRSLAAVFD